MSNQYKEILDTAIDAARRAGAFLKDGLGSARDFEFKGAIDIVTEMDLGAEDIIVSTVKKSFPEHAILAEERGGEAGKGKGADCCWIIDPLDGTTNYAHGFPVFNVSIAFEVSGEVVVGVVYDPMRDELFSAVKGEGAYLNNRRLSVSTASELDKSLLATGFPYDIRTSRRNNLKNFSNLAVRVQAIRRAGAAALDLAYVACGRFDGFWELKLKPWDLGAGLLIVEEAGGCVSGIAGEPPSIYDGDVVASNGLIHGEMLEILAMDEEL